MCTWFIPHYWSTLQSTKPKEAVDSSSPACCNKEKCWIDLSAGKAEAEVQFSAKYGGKDSKRSFGSSQPNQV